jgi:GR25 family glycosyltransferase involved in LPS biosynthesis
VRFISVVIIKTPNSPRIDPLLAQLKNVSGVKVNIIEATMGIDLGSPKAINIHNEFKFYGRDLTQNERACAISHTTARQIIAETEFGGVVLEDDARILDPELFVEQVSDFLQSHYGKRHILTLLSYSKKPQSKKSRNRQTRTFRLLAEAPLAVAAALTPSAARSLISAAAERSMTSDWPTSQCIFFGLHTGVVMHGDSETVSIIGEEEKRIVRMSLRLLSSYGMVRTKRRLFQKVDTWRIHAKQG